VVAVSVWASDSRGRPTLYPIASWGRARSLFDNSRTARQRTSGVHPRAGI